MKTSELAPPPMLAYETAATHLTTRVPITSPDSLVGDVRRDLIGKCFDSVAEIAVCVDGRLVGLLNVEDALSAPAGTPVGSLMDADPPVVAPGTDQEVVTWRAVRHRESSLAVVGANGRFLGMIPAQRLLGVLLWEHDEDLARLGGFMRDTASARTASQEPVVRRFFHRLPWLLVGLAGAFLAAQIIGAFEVQLRDRVILTFFLPGVVYLADAVGTQTEALVIRGLSVGVSIGQVLWRELLTGFLVGAALSLAFFPFAWWQWGRADVAFAVALALFAACSIASVVAMALPWLFHRLGTDPAFGSGPLGTVIQDLLSILLYLVIGASLVRAA